MYASYHIIDSSQYVLLLSHAGTRLAKAFAGSSRTAYKNKSKMFLMFCKKFNIDYHHLKLADVLAFMEVLASSNLSCSTIYGYMSAINAISLQVNIDITVFCHKKCPCLNHALGYYHFLPIQNKFCHPWLCTLFFKQCQNK